MSAPASAPDPAPRRALLRFAANPDPALDYMVTLTAPLHDGSGVEIRFVPDTQVLDAACLPVYLAALPAGGPESLAALVLGDLANELLPRWVRVTLSAGDPGGVRHVVVMEERQPRWDNAALLGRLAAL